MQRLPGYSAAPDGPWWNTNSCTTRPPTRCSVTMRSMWPGVTL